MERSILFSLEGSQKEATNWLEKNNHGTIEKSNFTCACGQSESVNFETIGGEKCTIIFCDECFEKASYKERF